MIVQRIKEFNTCYGCSENKTPRQNSLLKVFIKEIPTGENEKRGRKGWESPQTMTSDVNEGKKGEWG